MGCGRVGGGGRLTMQAVPEPLAVISLVSSSISKERVKPSIALHRSVEAERLIFSRI